jgi:hypothetical protein
LHALDSGLRRNDEAGIVSRLKLMNQKYTEEIA